MVGLDLIQILVGATGLPKESVTIEFERILKNSGKSPEALTIEEVRALMADYLQDVLLQAKNELRAFDDDGDLSV